MPTTPGRIRQTWCTGGRDQTDLRLPPQAFTGQEAPDELLATLATLKASSQARERQVAACMIHNLFDEYRFFAKYPDKELAITAALFGGLVQRGLVAGRWLDLALRYLLVRLLLSCWTLDAVC